MSVQYWSKKLKQHGDLFVELTQTSSYPTYTMREFSLTNTKVGRDICLSSFPHFLSLNQSIHLSSSLSPSSDQ